MQRFYKSCMQFNEFLNLPAHKNFAVLAILLTFSVNKGEK